MGSGVGAAAAARALDALGYVPALLQDEEDEEARTKAWRQRVRPAKKAAADHGGDVKIVPPPRERVVRAKRAALHRRLQQARTADRTLAASIREHYRERLAEGKRRRVAAAFAAWRAQVEARVAGLSARLRRSALAIGAAHRSADAERARMAAVEAEAAAAAQQRDQAATVRFSQAWRTREEKRAGGDVTGEIGIGAGAVPAAASPASAAAAAKHREEMRRTFMAKSRLAARRKAQASAAGLGPASPSSQPAAAAGTPGGKRGAAAPAAKARRAGAMDALPELESLLALDTARRERHQALIAAAQREGAAATAAGPGPGAGAAAATAEQAVEAILRGVGLGPRVAARRVATVGSGWSAAASAPDPAPAATRADWHRGGGLQWTPEEGTASMAAAVEAGAALEPVVEGESEGEGEGDKEEDGAVGRLYAEMAEMMRRIEALQREMGEEGVGEEVAEEMMTTAELEREIEACRRSLAAASRSLQRPQAGRAAGGARAAFDPRLDSLLAQRRRLEEEAAELRTQEALESLTSGGGRSSGAGGAVSSSTSSSSSSSSSGGYHNRLRGGRPSTAFPRRQQRGLAAFAGLEVDLGASSSVERGEGRGGGLSSGSETVALRSRAPLGESSSLGTGGSQSLHQDEFVGIEVAEGQMAEQTLLQEEMSLEEALGLVDAEGMEEVEEGGLPAQYLEARPSLGQAFHQGRADVLRRMEPQQGGMSGSGRGERSRV